MKRDLDIGLLRTFITVADTGGFTRASRRLRLTQAGVSLQIKRLEAVVGTRLFQRSGRRISVTESGERLLRHARALLRVNDEALADMTGGGAKGMIRLGTPEDLAGRYLESTLGAFHARYPNVRIEVDCDSSGALLKALGEGRHDMAIVKSPEAAAGADLLPTQAAPSSRTGAGVRLGREQLVWVRAADFALDEESAVPLVLFGQGSQCRSTTLALCEQAGRAVEVVYSGPTMAAVLAAIRSGLGIGTLLEKTVPDDLVVVDGEALGLPELPIFGVDLIVGPVRLSQAARAFAEFMLETFVGEGEQAGDLSRPLPPVAAAGAGLRP